MKKTPGGRSLGASRFAPLLLAEQSFLFLAADLERRHREQARRRLRQPARKSRAPNPPGNQALPPPSRGGKARSNQRRFRRQKFVSRRRGHRWTAEADGFYRCAICGARTHWPRLFLTEICLRKSWRVAVAAQERARLADAGPGPRLR